MATEWLRKNLQTLIFINFALASKLSRGAVKVVFMHTEFKSLDELEHQLGIVRTKIVLRQN